MSGLPPELARAVDAVVEASGLGGEAANRARADLERHLADGLAAGRTPEDLLERFGDPAAAARLLRRSHPPVPPRRGPASGRSGGRLAGLATDVRHVARGLARSPAFTATASLVLALGIAATAVVFTAVSEILLSSLPVAEPERLVDVWADVRGGNSFSGFAWDDWTAYRERDDVLAGLAAFSARRMRLGEDDDAVGMVVSAGYFDLLGVRPAVGRADFPEAPPFGAEAVAVVSHGFWRRALGGDPEAVGRTLRLDDHPVTVVGIAPEGFTGTFIGFPVDVWLPAAAADAFLPGFDPDDRSRRPFELIGRLRPGVSPEAAASALNAVAARLEAEHPETNRGRRVRVTRTTGIDHSLQAGVTAFVAILLAVSGLVLLIACLNVGTLLLVRTLAREREIAVRIALGAGRARLGTQLLAEAAALVGLGTAGGVLAASRLNALVRDGVRAASGGVAFDLTLDARALALTAGAALLAVLVAGAAPAAHVLRRDPAGALRARGGRGGGARLRAALVVGQVAVSAALVAATGLLARSVVEGGRADPGFDADRVAGFALTLDVERYGPGERAAVQRALLEALRADPAVEGASLADAPLLGVGRSPARLEVPGARPPAGEEAFVVDARRVGSAYLATAGIPLLRGRDFVGEDDGGGQPVAVVSRAFESRFWPDAEAPGRTIRVDGVEHRVVGVAADARWVVQDPTPDPLVYLSLAGRAPAVPHVLLRSTSPAALTGVVREAVSDLVPDHPPVRPVPARETLRRGLFPQRVGAALVGAMGAAALALAALGLYGLVQFTVARDRHELGVRLALGGSRRAVMAVVLRRGFLLAALGTGAGVVAARLLAPGLGSFLVGVGPGDPLTYAAVAGAFGAVALGASWLPARRAGRIQPAEALRGE